MKWAIPGLAVVLLIGVSGCGRHKSHKSADQGYEPRGTYSTDPRDIAHNGIPTKYTGPKTHDQIYADYAAAKMRLRLSWANDLRAAAAHGAEGVVPPMLEVIDSGQGVQVTNIGNQSLCLDLRRSYAKLGQSLDYQCALWAVNGGLHNCVDYAPGEKKFLRMSSARPDLPDCSGQPLEFRIGTWEKKGPGWWSDVAIDGFERETARLETDNTLYASMIAVPTDFWKDDFIDAVTTSMNEMPVGAKRVAMWGDWIDAAEATLPMHPHVAPEERAAQAAQLNQVGEVEAQLRAIKGLRLTVSQQRQSDRDKQFPDYLRVEDHLDSATVYHDLGAVFYVNLTRVGRDPQTGQESLCAMRGLGRGTSAGTWVSKNQPAQFTISSRSGACANLENTTLEMVVNDFNGRLTFGSPSALDRMQAETEAKLQSLQASR